MAKKLTPMMAQYQQVKDQYPDAFLFYRLGDFYELFNDDAVKGAQILELTLTTRNHSAANPIPMCGVPHKAVDGYVDILIDKGYKVAICEQMEDPKKAKGMVKRAVTRLITPGTQMDQSGDAARNNNYLAALNQQGSTFELAYADLATGELKTTTLKGKNAALNELINLQTKEIVADDSLSSEIEQQLTKRNILLSKQSEILKNAEVSYLTQDLERPGEKQVVAQLVSYLLTTQKRSLDHLQKAISYQPSSYMKIDHYSKTNLELTTNMRSGKRQGTLVWLLDETKTAMGSRLLKRWLDRPLIDAEQIEQRQDKVQVLLETEEPMQEQLRSHDQLDLLFEMEQPLAFVLAKMEIAGIKVERETLQGMQAENEKTLESLTQEIYDLAGQEFNINSPKQLGTILFEDMGLPLEYTKKTKTGYSTAVDVLERLAPIAPIVSKILEYRQISKLQSTYIIGLQEAIAADGKIHTRYVQDLTQTGRLSSVDPNLQNIPVRLEQGRLIRKAFVPEWADSVLLSSDYSQIELRVLAHISQDEHLIAAFQHGEDIHTATAMRVFGIEKAEDVTPNDRRNAKAVNFGVVYGISDFGLANNLGISRKAAKDYIQTYFERFPGIKNYMETIVREARDKGYVETIYHRRRSLPDINSRNFNIRNFAERTAINSPIQGSAADILKVAMINLDRALTEKNFKSRMLLQVHDEIVLEVPADELTAVRQLVKETMEAAIELAVPLVADENAGQTWYEAK